MINKINKERRRSMNAAPPDPVTRASGKEPRRTLYKNRKGHKAEQPILCRYEKTKIPIEKDTYDFLIPFALFSYFSQSVSPQLKKIPVSLKSQLEKHKLIYWL
jgi:hypothetical protein